MNGRKSRTRRRPSAQRERGHEQDQEVAVGQRKTPRARIIPPSPARYRAPASPRVAVSIPRAARLRAPREPICTRRRRCAGGDAIRGGASRPSGGAWTTACRRCADAEGSDSVSEGSERYPATRRDPSGGAWDHRVPKVRGHRGWRFSLLEVPAIPGDATTPKRLARSGRPREMAAARTPRVAMQSWCRGPSHTRVMRRDPQAAALGTTACRRRRGGRPMSTHKTRPQDQEV